MPHKATEVRVRGAPYEVGPILIRQLSSDHDGDGLHDLQWNTSGNLEEAHIVAACPFGGPIALALRRDTSSENQIDNMIYLYSSNGDQLVNPSAARNKERQSRSDATAGSNSNRVIGGLLYAGRPSGSKNASGLGGESSVLADNYICITEIGRQYNEDKTNATIHYMCWDDNDTLLVVLSNGAVWAFSSTGSPAAPKPLVVKDAHMYQSIEYGVAIITRRNTAVLVYMSGGALMKLEVAIDLTPEMAVCSFAALPRNRFPARIVDNIVGGHKVPMRMENTTHELIIATFAAGPDEPCDVFLATFETETAKTSCFQLGIDKAKFPRGNISAFAVAPHKARLAMIMNWSGDKDNVYACSSDFQYIHRIGNTQTEVVPTQLFWIGDDIVGYTLLNSQFDPDDDFKTSIITMPYPGDQHSFNPPPTDDADEESALIEIEIANLPVDAHIIQESSDSIRILSSDTFQIVQVVPNDIRYTFTTAEDVYGSSSQTTTAWTLCAAYDAYASESPSCIELINDVMRRAGEIDVAIDKLVTLAGFELDVDAQKRYLRVANFGKSFTNTYCTDNFVNMCRRLKALQYLRSIGTLLTLDQLAAMEDSRLVQRLAAHQHFQMAFEMSEVLNLSVAPLLTTWAKHVLSSIPKAGDASTHERQSYFEIVTDMILSKFEVNQHRGGELPYVQVAHHAYKFGKVQGDQLYLDYALRLVNAAPSARSRFDALLLWNQYHEALKVAVQSGDANMIYMVLAQLMEVNRDDYDIERTLIPLMNGFPESASLLRTFVRTADAAINAAAGGGRLGGGRRGSLSDSSSASLVRVYKNIYKEFETSCRLDDYFIEEGKARRDVASNATSLQLQRSSIGLRDACRGVEEGLRNERGGANNSKLMHMHSSLVDKQSDLAAKLKNNAFLHASLIDTIRLCFENNRYNDAMDLAQNFAVNEKMLTWAKLRAYISAENWDEIDKMASAKKSPIGFDAYVTLLLEANQPLQAAKHIPKLQPIEKRMELYVACGDWKGACDDCIRSREEDMLTQLRSRAKTDSALAIIDAALRKVGR